MVNFEPIKEKIWKAAQKQNRQKFDKSCSDLVDKAVGNWWRVGWNILPKDIDELVKLLEKTAKCAHREWIKAMKCGDAPAEDISPGEGFACCAKLVKDLQKELKAAKSEKSNHIK